MQKLLLIAVLAWPLVCSAETPPHDVPVVNEQDTSINTAIIPMTKLENDSYDWWKRHDEELATKDKIHPQIVLIGDSITHFWAGEPAAKTARGPIAWKETFGDLPVLNMGFGYDRTQNVLWRLDHGEFDGLAPKWVVLNIGTNNIKPTAHARANTPAEIVAGIVAIIDRVHTKSPQTHIIVMAVFPRGGSPSDAFRPKIAEINALLVETVKTHPEVTFLDIGSQFLQSDGTLPKDIMFDGTHPTEEGYAIWGKALVDAGIRN